MSLGECWCVTFGSKVWHWLVPLLEGEYSGRQHSETCILTATCSSCGFVGDGDCQKGFETAGRKVLDAVHLAVPCEHSRSASKVCPLT